MMFPLMLVWPLPPTVKSPVAMVIGPVRFNVPLDGMTLIAALLAMTFAEIVLLATSDWAIPPSASVPFCRVYEPTLLSKATAAMP